MKIASLMTTLIFAFFSSTAAGQESAPTAEFNHWTLNKSASRSISAARGSAVTIKVSDTCDAFNVDIVEVPDLDKQTPNNTFGPAAAQVTIDFTDVFDCYVAPSPQETKAIYNGLTNFRVDVAVKPGRSAPVHAIKPTWDKFGGDSAKFLNWFTTTIATCTASKVCDASTLGDLKTAKSMTDEGKYVALLKKVGLANGTHADVKFLQPVSFLVYINETDWRTEFAGAFVLSDLVNPQYAIRDDIVVRDRAAEDSQSIALAAFVHLSNRRWKGDHWAVTFGLGVNNSSDLNIFFGPSWRMGGAGYITAGYNWGKVDRLPNGQVVGAPPINAENTLNGLPKKTDGGWFIGWSYPFLGNARDTLVKPFVKPSETK